jgi:hypothetical protein
MSDTHHWPQCPIRSPFVEPFYIPKRPKPRMLTRYAYYVFGPPLLGAFLLTMFYSANILRAIWTLVNF